MTNVSSLTSASGLNFLDPAVANRATGKQNLDVNDFLKLLTVQLQSQDPMKPMDDLNFIGQMASFTSLEQMRGLSQNFEQFTSAERLVSAQNYLGRIVTIDAGNGIVTGEVTKVTIKEGKPQILIGGKPYDIDDVTSVTPKPADAVAVAPTTPQIIGTAPTAPIQSNP